MTAFQKQFLRDWRYGDKSGGMHHAFRILTGSENGDAVLGGAEGLNAFVCLLAVVQAGGHAMDGKIRGADEGWGAPFGRLDAVMGFDMPIDFV